MVAAARQAPPGFGGYFLVVETQKGELGVRAQNTVIGGLLKAVARRQFGTIVARHAGDRYDKRFSSWDHLVALVFAQLGGISSLRELETVWNAQGAHHYHLGSGRIYRSTLSDAGARRPPAVFAEVFARLSAAAGCTLPHRGGKVLRLLDATPIPLTTLCQWAQWNGRTRGLKAHVVYDPDADRPVRLAITPATVNDVVAGRDFPIEPGAVYVFDKAYVDYAWWHRLHQAGCCFVTRPKSNVRWRVVERRRPPDADGGDGRADGGADGRADDRQAGETVIQTDDVVELPTPGRARLPVRLRRIVLAREDGTPLTLVSNDLQRPAAEIAALYRDRWQIELLFRWIKQHLKIRRFLGRSENAIRLQITAAMIAYLLLRIAAHLSRSRWPALRFADLVRTRLFERRPLANLGDPNPPRTKPPDNHQLTFAYA